MLATKIKLRPTKEQEELFWKSAGTARFIYNFVIAHQNQSFNLNFGFVPSGVLRKHLTQLKKTEEYGWLKEVGSNVIKQAAIDCYGAYDRYFKGIGGKPKFKSRHKTKPSFYVNYESFKRTQDGFHGEKLGSVKTCQPLPELEDGKQYSNPRISHDGRNWFLSIGYEVEPYDVKLTDKVLGIDVGVKELAVDSNGIFYKNINKTKEVRRLEKKLKREQRKLSRKLEANISSYAANGKPMYALPLKECQNIQKQNDVIRRIHKRLTDIRTNHIHQTTTAIVKTKPGRIVMETLNIKGMMKNKHLSKVIANQKLYEFKRQLKYKCERYGIEFVEADKWFPSSKTCSDCGQIKSDLKLKDRVFICDCGLRIDRDLNAAINLANYPI